MYLQGVIAGTKGWSGHCRQRTTCPGSKNIVNSGGYTVNRGDSNLKNVEANCTRRNIDIRVKTRRFELDDRWHVWIIRREVYRDLERHPAVILFNLDHKTRKLLKEGTCSRFPQDPLLCLPIRRGWHQILGMLTRSTQDKS
jgi:hypothetical protein